MTFNKRHVIDMPENMFGVSSETSFGDLFQLQHGSSPNSRSSVASRLRMEETDPFSIGRMFPPHTMDVFSLYHQKQSPVYKSPIVVDEEACHGFLSHISSSPPSADMHPTLSTFNYNIPPRNMGQVHGMSLDVSSGFNAHQLTSSFQMLQVSHHNGLRAEEASSSIIHPSAQYNHYPVHPQATHHRPMEHTPITTTIGDSHSLAKEQPTDLSVRNNVPQNIYIARTVDEDSRKNADASRETYDDRSESPLRRLTYTHLSDVSNDSEEDSEENDRKAKAVTRGFAKKRFEKLVPYQLALPWMSTQPVIERPTLSMIDPAASYAQIVMDHFAAPEIASYICWLLNSCHYNKINSLWGKEPIQKTQEKIVVLTEESINEASIAAHHAGSVGDATEVIDLTLDNSDDESGIVSGHIHAEPPPACPKHNQHLLTEESTAEQMIQQNHHTSSAPQIKVQCSLPLHRIRLPLTLHLESTKLSVDSITPSDKYSTPYHSLRRRSSSRNSSAQEDYNNPRNMLQEHSDFPRRKYPMKNISDESQTQLFSRDSASVPTCQKRPYKELKPDYEAALGSWPKQLRRSPRFQAMAKQPTCTHVKRKMRPQNNQERHKPNSTDQKAQCVAPSQPRRSTRLKAESRECASASEKRRREPWNHKGLLRFVAQNACNLKSNVWTEWKEGEPRRSLRLAKKMQCRRYFLRPRLHTKS